MLSIKLPDELPFENLYLKQMVQGMEEGPRCLAEEYTQFEYTVDSSELYRKFANFSFYGKLPWFIIKNMNETVPLVVPNQIIKMPQTKPSTEKLSKII